MKHKLTNNWGLKLGSLIFAFFLWIIVTNMNDPVTQYRIYNVPVRLANTDVITSQGKTYEVLDGTDVIDTVTISAARSIIDSIDEDDIVAVADFNELTLQNTVAIELSTKKYNTSLESIRGSISEVELQIEDLKTKTFALSANTIGTVGDGYMIGDVSLAQNQVRVSGPESIIDQITSARVDVSVTGFAQDIVTDADILLLDADGTPVESDMLTTNISSVKVNVELLQTKSVGLSFSAMGIPADGYAATGEITSDPETVLVAGKSSVLSKLDTITVPEDVLNITGQTGDMLAVVDIRDYLPDGVTLADSSSDGNVAVTVYIEKTVDKRLTIQPEAIAWVNVPEGYTVELVDPDGEFEVTINGLRTVVNEIGSGDVTVTADLDGILDQEDTVGSLYHVNLALSSEKGNVTSGSTVQVWFRLNTE